MARRLKISEARGKLPELAKFLSRHPDKTVVLEHRDLDERLVVTTERYLRYLETAVKELNKRSARRFRLQEASPACSPTRSSRLLFTR